MNYSNFARSKISPISSTSTSWNLLPGDGYWFRENQRCIIWCDDYHNDIFAANKAGQAELVTINTLVGDQVTLATRGEEGTVARNFNATGKTYSIMAVGSAEIFESFEPGTAVEKKIVIDLSQSGEDDPTGIVRMNTIVGTPVYARTARYTYTITMAGKFTLNKTDVHIEDMSDILSKTPTDVNTVTIVTNAECDLTNRRIIITVYL